MGVITMAAKESPSIIVSYRLVKNAKQKEGYLPRSGRETSETPVPAFLMCIFCTNKANFQGYNYHK
jgi:hypothetical protein